MKTKMKLAIVMLGSLITGVAAAQGIGSGSAVAPQHDRKAMIEKFDTNKDGKLDDTEKAALRASMKQKHEERKAEMLAKYDTNKDGKLDQNERTVARNDKLAEEFKKLDTDGNGQLSLGEFQAGKFGHGKFGHQGRHGRGGMQRRGGMNRVK